MPELHPNTGQPACAVNGAISPGLEARLRKFFAEQERLRDVLDNTRDELDRVNADLLAFQNEYCTDAAREEEYLTCLGKILGCDPRIDPEELEKAIANPQGIDDILEELENRAKSGSVREAK